MPCSCCGSSWACPCNPPSSVSVTISSPYTISSAAGGVNYISPLAGTYVFARDYDYESVAGTPSVLYYSFLPAGVSWVQSQQIGPAQWKDVAVGAVYALATVACSGSSGTPVTVSGLQFRGKPSANLVQFGSTYASITTVTSDSFNYPSSTNMPYAPCGTTTSISSDWYFRDGFYGYPAMGGGVYSPGSSGFWTDVGRLSISINY